MKIGIALFLLSIVVVGCNSEGGSEGPATIPADQISSSIEGDPFHGLGIRYDGYYMEELGGVVYLIRFFPDGHAVLINGTADVKHELPSYLTANAKGDPGKGWYNVPVTVKEDSIFFKTYPEKGEISYRGNIPATSLVRLFRHSHINGHRSVKEYIFQPDTSPTPSQ